MGSVSYQLGNIAPETQDEHRLGKMRKKNIRKSRSKFYTKDYRGVGRGD